MTAGVDEYDFLGVGFGPSNLGLAIAIEEHNNACAPSERLTACFVESKDAFAWHPGMLLPGTTMQISFLKDLVTQRNTASRFTFLNYLSEHGRLNHFINLQTFFPSRVEFHDYLAWAASNVDAEVRYGTRAVEVFRSDDGYGVRTKGATGATIHAKNIVLAGGLSAKLPDGVTASARQFHNHNLLGDLKELPSRSHRSFIVIGAGQSAAEVADYLHATYPDSSVHAVFGKYGYSPADDSPYANRIFDPTAVDDFYSASIDLRNQLLDYHRSTNYSAVDLPLIEQLYAREYAERVDGERRLFVHGASRLITTIEDADGIRASVEHGPTGLREDLVCDAVVYATGFTPLDLPGILGELLDEIEFDAAGPRISRDYRVVTGGGGSVYLQGGTEHTHGLTSSLLSNIAVRSGEIVKSVAGARVPARV
ncbi:MAG: SidA/IucD/PvdA family monooxygenase [Rhodococcus sp. (in: high G+C Gram-positive bacteria)]